MAARASIAVQDGETTPVTHTFTPNGFDAKGVNFWRNLNSSVPSASETISMLVQDSPSAPSDISIPGKKVAPRKVECRLKDPATYVDGVSGLTLVDYINEGIVTFLFHPRSPQQSNKNLRVMLQQLITNTNGNQVLYAIEQGEAVY